MLFNRGIYTRVNKWDLRFQRHYQNSCLLECDVVQFDSGILTFRGTCFLYLQIRRIFYITKYNKYNALLDKYFSLFFLILCKKAILFDGLLECGVMWFMSTEFFCPENTRSKFLQNVCDYLAKHTKSNPRTSLS